MIEEIDVQNLGDISLYQDADMGASLQIAFGEKKAPCHELYILVPEMYVDFSGHFVRVSKCYKRRVILRHES